MTSDGDSIGGLGREGLSTTAGCRRVWIANDELRALQVFLVVDFRTHQVLDTHWIDNERHAHVDDLAVAIFGFFIECKTVLKPAY